MKLLATLFKQKKKKVERTMDFYQESINRVGKEQFVKLIQRGQRLPIGVL